MSLKGGCEPRKQLSFRFVNVNPSARGGSGHTRQVTYSHVGGQRSRVSKAHIGWAQTHEEKHGKVIKRLSPRSRGGHGPTRNASPSSISPSKVCLLMVDEVQSRKQEQENCDNHDARDLIDFTFCGIVDPFTSHPTSSFPVDLVEACSAYRLSVMAPCLVPPASDEAVSQAVKYWYPLSQNDPAIFTAFIFSALSHKRIRWLLKGQMGGLFQPRYYRWRKYSYMIAIKLVNQTIQDSVPAVTDSLILCVLLLAEVANDAGQRDWTKKSPFHAPLRSLQWLDVFGSKVSNMNHTGGLIKLINLKGGLKNIKLPGLSPVLCLFGILNASRNLSQPSLPFISLFGNQPVTLKEVLGFGLNDVERNFGTLRPFGFTAEMVEVFQGMKVFASILEDYLEGSIPEPNLRLISEQRNLLQYCLMSLPSAIQPGEIPSRENQFYEACRLSAVIFSIGVTFPLPGPTAPFATLARFLQTALQDASVLLNWSSSPDVVRALVWVFTMGGIAATGVPERQWFINALGEAAIHASISGWLGLKRILESTLWLDRACDSAGEALWNEVESLILRSCSSRLDQKNTASQVSFDPRSASRREPPCRQCRRKKVRCDKKEPCQNCMKSGLPCSYGGVSSHGPEKGEDYVKLQERVKILEAQLATRPEN